MSFTRKYINWGTYLTWVVGYITLVQTQWTSWKSLNVFSSVSLLQNVPIPIPTLRTCITVAYILDMCWTVISVCGINFMFYVDETFLIMSIRIEHTFSRPDMDVNGFFQAFSWFVTQNSGHYQTMYFPKFRLT